MLCYGYRLCINFYEYKKKLQPFTMSQVLLQNRFIDIRKNHAISMPCGETI